MYEPQPKKSVQQKFKDTFTPSRVGLLSWAFAAGLMGTVGLASYQFGTPDSFQVSRSDGYGGLALPEAGQVSTTASVGARGQNGQIEVFQMPNSGEKELSKLAQSQIEVLQDQIVRLRRRLSTLTEQNSAYSRRIAALEERSINSGQSLPATAAPSPIETIPEADILAQDTNRRVVSMAPMPKPQTQVTIAETNTMSLSEPLVSPSRVPSTTTLDQSRPLRATRLINIHTGQQDNRPDVLQQNQEPVRIVELPSANGTPLTTGSINPEAIETFNDQPTTNVEKQKVIEPSQAVGRLGGGGKSVLMRSNFGAVIGTFDSTAAAAKAWATFKEQNEERMRDLRPLIKERQAPEGGVSLLAGPFGNAADAAVACFYLLEVTEYCQPALFAGEPLVTASEFRQNAF